MGDRHLLFCEALSVLVVFISIFARGWWYIGISPHLNLARPTRAGEAFAGCSHVELKDFGVTGNDGQQRQLTWSLCDVEAANKVTLALKTLLPKRGRKSHSSKQRPKMPIEPVPCDQDLGMIPVSPPHPANDVHLYACNVCERSYSRIDHLKRHSRSRTPILLWLSDSGVCWIIDAVSDNLWFRYPGKAIPMQHMWKEFH